jgi:carbonic anhydrase
LWYHYLPVGYPLRLVNDGHTVGVTFPDQYKAGLGVSDGVSATEMLQDNNFFRLYKLTIHSPAEHEIHGIRHPLEVQLMHQNPSTQQTGVFSVWFKEGNSSTFLSQLMENGLPEHEMDETNMNTAGAPTLVDRPTRTAGLRLDLLMTAADGVTPSPQGVIAYEGSMTEPPCETKVQWWVRRVPRDASLKQIQELSNLIKRLDGPTGNARELQHADARGAELMDLIDAKYDEDTGAFKGEVGTTELHIGAEGVAVEAPAVPCYNMAGFDAQSAHDSAAVVDAKNKYVAAKLEATSMRVWKTTATANLATTEALYSGAAGPVEQINLKWDVIAKQQELALASSKADAASAAESAACTEALPVVCKAACADPESCQEGEMTSECQAALSNLNDAPPTNTTAPTEPPEGVVDTGLDYNPKVVLPGAEAGNPFNPSVAERSSRIGGKGGMPYAPRDLATSIRQPLVPGAPVPVASLLARRT